VARDLNNLAELLQATNGLEGAEPLMRRAVTILLTFTRKAAYEHPHLRAIQENHRELLTAMGLPKEDV
jgi:hypothetical protein